MIHGPPETPEDDAAIRALHGLAGRCASEAYSRATYSRGDSDSMTWFFEGTAAEAAALAFIAEATRIARSWWRVTPTARPDYRSSY